MYSRATSAREVLTLLLRLVVSCLAVVKGRLPLRVESEAASTLCDRLVHILILEPREVNDIPNYSIKIAIKILTSITAIWVIELSAPPPPPPGSS